MHSILDAPEPAKQDGIRGRAMIYLSFAGGLRIPVLIGLRTDDLTLQPPSIFVHGKGRKELCLPPWKETTSALRAWLAVMDMASAPELFLDDRGQSMTRSGFEYISEKHAQTAVKRYSSLATKRIWGLGSNGTEKSVNPQRLCHYFSFFFRY
jgi:site-specific recombinase XerD